MTKTPAIALLTDFGLKDHYVGTMKGVILKINPTIPLIDISHSVPPGEITHGALLLKASYHYFPKGTVFLTVIDPGVGSKRKAIIVKTEDYTFVAPDNGVLSYALTSESIVSIVELTNPRYFLYPLSHTFHGRDLFAPIAAHASRGVPEERFGSICSDIKELSWPEAEIMGNTIEGIILIADHFGNLITNISYQLISQYLVDNQLLQSDELTIIKNEPHQQIVIEEAAIFQIQLGDWHIKGLNRSYNESNEFSILAIIGSSGLMEISVNNGNAQNLLGCYGGEPITLSIYPKK